MPFPFAPKSLSIVQKSRTFHRRCPAYVRSSDSSSCLEQICLNSIEQSLWFQAVWSQVGKLRIQPLSRELAVNSLTTRRNGRFSEPWTPTSNNLLGSFRVRFISFERLKIIPFLRFFKRNFLNSEINQDRWNGPWSRARATTVDSSLFFFRSTSFRSPVKDVLSNYQNISVVLAHKLRRERVVSHGDVTWLTFLQITIQGNDAAASLFNGVTDRN
jgi:hypothetical protein